MFILFNNIEDFNVWNDSMNQQLGIPNDEGTESYSTYQTSELTDDVLAYFDNRCDTSNLTVITYDQAVTMGFFPPSDIYD
jgi:hypothetical protein